MFNFNFSDNKLIAFNPDITRGDFAKKTSQLSETFKILGIKKLALFIEDSLSFAMIITAAIDSNVDILLPPNLLPDNLEWVEKNSDLFLTDDSFKNFKILSKNPLMPPRICKYSTSRIYLKTSGSSGNSKIICKNITQILLEVQALHLIVPQDKDLHLIRSVTCQHCYGLSFAIFLPLYQGWTFHRYQLLFPEYLIKESLQQPKTIWISSPALLANININNPKLKQANIDTIISSGGALPPAVATRLVQHIHSCSIIEIYGSTETGAIAHKVNDHWQALNGLSIGTDENDALWVKGAWVEEKQQTADVIEQTTQGFQLLGRIDRIVKIGDKRISLTKIEQELLKHPNVFDAFIAMHPKKQRPAAWIALNESGINKYKESRLELINSLKSFLRITTENLALPRFWRFTEKLPRNAQSKILISDFNQAFKTKNERIINE